MSEWNRDRIQQRSLAIIIGVMAVIAIFAIINIVYGLYPKIPTTFEEFLINPVTNWNITQTALFASAVAIIGNIRFLNRILFPWVSLVERRLNNIERSLEPHLYVSELVPQRTEQPENRTGWWSRHRQGVHDILTLSLVAATLILVVLTYWQVSESKKLFEETTDSSKKLQEIIDKNNQLLETQNRAVTEIAYQTAVQAYNDGKPFTIKIDDCTFNETDKMVSHKVAAEDNTSNPATIDFKVLTTYGYYTTPNDDNSSQLDKLNEFATTQEITGPGKNPDFQLVISSILDSTKNLDRANLYFTYKFEYAPYSAAKNTEITRIDDSMMPRLLVGFEMNEITHEWQKITNNENIACS